jgi:hypothetical protein
MDVEMIAFIILRRLQRRRERRRKKMFWIHPIVTVEEDYRGGTASEESDVTSITIGRKGTAVYC